MNYPKYLEAIYGKRIWIPAQKDSARAFQRYVREVKAGTREQNADMKIVNGRVKISGALGVMEINGILCEMIHENNKDKHPFFVEESYVLDWMYPYLEPHGLIMKLNKEKLPELSDAVVKKDTEFWKGYADKLMNRADFKSNPEARKAFSKLRCAIAGIYQYREMYDEAEAALRQALTLCPISPEGSYRLAQMYERQDRIAEARAVMEKYVALDPKDAEDSKEKAERYLARLMEKPERTKAESKPAEDKSEAVESEIAKLGHKSSTVRAEARRKLEELGVAAKPALKKWKNADDFETRLAVRDLLKKLEPPAEEAPTPLDQRGGHRHINHRGGVVF
jgi:tetratricopeptide (TPR) repeat protein